MSVIDLMRKLQQGFASPAQNLLQSPDVVVNTGQHQLPIYTQQQGMPMGHVQSVDGYAPQPYGQGFENMLQQGGYSPQTSAHAFFSPGQGQYGGMPVQNSNMFMPNGGAGADPMGWIQQAQMNNSRRIRSR